MLKKTLLLLLVVLATLSLMSSNGYAEGRAKIGLMVDGAYLTENSNPWLTDSWVTGDSDFDLGIQSLTKKSPIYLTHVVLAIPYNTPDTGWSFTLGGSTFYYSSFSNTGLHPYLSPHGIFANENGALWTEYSLGTLDPGQWVNLAFSETNLPANMILHFDAYGSSLAAPQNGWYFNPYSHDVTVNPEPVSAVLFLLGGLGLSTRGLLRKK